MENQNEKIANFKLTISDSCPEEQKQIIQLYWENSQFELLNTPRLVKIRFDLTNYELTKLVTSYSSFTLYLYCESCNSYEKKDGNTQSKFRSYIADIKRRRNYKSYTCCNCSKQERKRIELEKKQKRQELEDKLNTAIEDKNWEQLSTFDRIVLGKCLEMDYDKLSTHYGKILGQTHFIKLIKALENIENLNLIVLNRDSWSNYIIHFQYLSRLKECEEDINVIEQKRQEKAIEIDPETNQLKFKLTVNETQKFPDSPLHAGTVVFEERIVIEPGVEYIFGQWERANDHLYLTLMPLENIEKTPTQKRISKLPISLRKGVQDFLNNMGKNYKS